MTDRDKALTALSQALRLEQEGRSFYLQAAERRLMRRAAPCWPMMSGYMLT